MMSLRNNQGLSLIEVIITVALILIAGGALVQLGVTALDTSDASRMRGISLQKANEALEFARSVRDNDSTGFFNLNGDYYLDESGDLEDAGTIFKVTACVPGSTFAPSNDCQENISVSGSTVSVYRVVRITGSADRKEVTAFVYWNNSGSYSNVTTSTVLAKWRL